MIHDALQLYIKLPLISCIDPHKPPEVNLVFIKEVFKETRHTNPQKRGTNNVCVAS
jgi:hypothetical protein